MIWEVVKANKKSFLVGTAHFFPYSFRTSLSRFIKNASTVLLEGPLDQESMARVVEAGCQKEKEGHLFEELDEKTVNEITEALVPFSRRRDLLSICNIGSFREENPVYGMIKGMKPWMAFFRLWTAFLERQGWRYSVDLDAYRIAVEMNKAVVFLETIEEQIEVLEGLSYERILDFLRRVGRWHDYARGYAKAYLAGDMERLKSNSIGFPSRHHNVIDRRDQILFERMLTYLKQGDAVVCVGAPHIRGIGPMLQTTGYRIQGLFNH